MQARLYFGHWQSPLCSVLENWTRGNELQRPDFAPIVRLLRLIGGTRRIAVPHPTPILIGACNVLAKIGAELAGTDGFAEEIKLAVADQPVLRIGLDLDPINDIAQ
jgi:hypothetical protein